MVKLIWDIFAEPKVGISFLSIIDSLLQLWYLLANLGILIRRAQTLTLTFISKEGKCKCGCSAYSI